MNKKEYEAMIDKKLASVKEELIQEFKSRRMTNFEKLIENDRDNLIDELANNLCIDTDKHKINMVRPYLCGDCFYGKSGSCQLELKEWLESEVDEE